MTGGVPTLRHGVFLAPFDDFADPFRVLDAARTAERRGWDGFFLWDHVLRPEERPVADPWILLAAVATVTDTLLIGPMVTPLVRRRPQKVAREVVTLDRLSDRRLVLGVGLGVDTGRELSAFGEQVDPAARGRMLDESLDLLDELLSGERVEHRGESYLADGVRFLPPAPPGGIPVWVATRGTSVAPLRRAARRQGLFPIESGPAEIAAMLEVIAAERGGLDRFEVATIATGDVDAAEFAAVGVTWWMTTPAPGDPYESVMATIESGPPAG